MILCAGLSPAWQHTLHFSAMTPGEVNRAKNSAWCASGKVVNVAAALASLGVEHRMLTVVGGWPEHTFREDLKSTGVQSELVAVDSATRVCTTLLVDGGPTTELVEECGPISQAELRAFESAFHSAAKSANAVVVAGSMPKGVNRSLWRRLIESCEVPIVLDIRGEELMEALSIKPLLVKPNREELASTIGSALNSEAEIVQAAHEIRDRGAQWVLVTDGTKPALLVGDQAYRIGSAKVKTVNPIGCGDSLAAGIAWRTSLGESVPEAVGWGIAAAAANAETELPARFKRERVEQLVDEVRIESI